MVYVAVALVEAEKANIIADGSDFSSCMENL